MTPAEREQGSAAYTAYTEALSQAGALVGANRLQSSTTATTVRLSDGKPQVLDGPYVESKEQVCGYYLIDVPDLDAAISWAARCPPATAPSRSGPSGPCEVDGGSNPAVAGAADAVARRSYGKLVAFLAARTGDVAAAEDALSEAFAAALATWPERGCPANPEAWLLTVARRRAADAARRRRTGVAAAGRLRLLAEELADGGGPEEIPDHRLGLMFACAHPAIEPGIRAPLMLQAVLGLDAGAIGSAFLTSPAAMGKRLVRAKSKIRHAGIPLAVPGRAELAPRLDAVLDAIYAAFAEGWTDPGGTDPARRELTGEAIYLARVVGALLPDAPEALGLLALMLHAEARRAARRDPDGSYVPLGWQDPGLWDAGMIAEAEALLLRASGMGAIGRFQLEAAIQSAHAHRGRGGKVDWAGVVRLYDALMTLSVSPVVAVNRALAVARAEGHAAGLAALDAVAADPPLAEYQPYWAARAELLGRSGAHGAARAAYALAIGLARDAAVRTFLHNCRVALPS